MTNWGWILPLMLLACRGPVLKVEMQEVGKNLLANGGFKAEDGRFAGWEPWEDGFAVGPGRRRSEAVHCRNEAPARRGIGQRVRLGQTRPAPLVVSGWSKANEVSGGRDSEYSLYVDLIYEDGEEVWGQHVPFDPGTHDWQEVRLLIRPAKPVRELSVYGLFRGHTGEAWFDDFGLYELGDGEAVVFDGLPVAKGKVRRMENGGEFTTQDGLSLGYDPQSGQVTHLGIEGRELAQKGAPAGFLVRDVAAESGFFGFAAGKCRPLELELQARLEARADHLRIEGTVVNVAAGERAITLVFALPVAAAGWRWHEDVRNCQVIEAGREYAGAAPMGTGATGDLARYPWAVIEDGRAGLMLGADADRPAQYRLGYSAGTGQFYIAFDFGLTPETGAFPNAAPFALVLARTDPEWGFRAATRKYYQIFPEAFARRSPDQGIWMPFTDVSTVEGWEDFGFKYHEGINNVPFDDQAGVLSFRYTEPSTWWMRMPPEVPRTHEGVMAVLRQKAEEGDRRARAIEVSGSHDAQGRLQYQIRKEPWCDGAVFSSNPSPHLPGASEAEMNWNEAEMNWNEAVREKLYGAAAGGVQDGEYLDSVEGYVTATENFRRDHFRHARVPLTFSTVAKRPVIHKAFSVWEFATYLGTQLRGMDKLLFGNAVPDRFAFLAPAFDIMGTETNWLHGEGWRPPADSWFTFRRAMCYQKPYLLLMNTDYDRLTPELVEKYFQRCLFYGFFPSMFSHNAAENPYWQAPRWYERDRPLFRRYIPLIKRVAEAGWEPVTGARTDDPLIGVERFGPGASGETYIALFNFAPEGRSAHLRLVPEVLGWAPGGVVELLTGDRLSCQDGGVTVELGAEQVRVLRLER